MLEVTAAARSRLSEMLADYPDDVAVRVLLRNGRRTTRPGRRRPGDCVIEHQGRPVLLLDKQAAEHFGERTLDVREDDEGPHLRFCRVQRKAR